MNTVVAGLDEGLLFGSQIFAFSQLKTRHAHMASAVCEQAQKSTHTQSNFNVFILSPDYENHALLDDQIWCMIAYIPPAAHVYTLQAYY